MQLRKWVAKFVYPYLLIIVPRDILTHCGVRKKKGDVCKK